MNGNVPTIDAVPPVPFRELTFEQANAHLDAYLAGMPQRISALRRDIAERGGPAGALDGTAASVEALWDWYRDQGAAEGPGWRPDDPDLPLWAPHVPQGLFRGWTASLLRDVDRIAAYAADTVLHLDPTARWEIGVPPPGFSVPFHHHHEPVLVGRRVGRRNPRAAVAAAVARATGRAAQRIAPPARLLGILMLPEDAPDADVEVRRETTIYDLEITARKSRERRFDWTVWVGEMSEPLVGRDVFRALTARVAAADGIDEAVHEDREVLHVVSRLPRPEIERIVRDALRKEPTA